MTCIGFVGLGIMGKPMAKNLIKEGYKLIVHNRSRTAVKELVDFGAEEVFSPADVARNVDVLITMLPNSSDVKKVILGREGAIEGLTEGKIVIDMSSISPVVIREIASTLQEIGVRMMDAPVSGGEPGAINGTLAIMVGGNEKDYNQYYEKLSVMGKNVTRVGEVGSGNVAKLVNQSIVALNIASISEAFMLGSMSGVDPKNIFGAINGGLAGSNALDAKFPMMIEDNFKPGFTLELHKKDLDNILEVAKSHGTMMPLTSLVTDYVQELIRNGEGKSDHSALIKYFENLSSYKLTGEKDK